MKRGVIISGLFILLILFSTFFVTKFFIFDSSLESLAQPGPVVPNPPPASQTELHVYLEQPDTLDSIIPTIYGQTEFIINITGIDVDKMRSEIEDFGLEVLASETGPSLGYFKVSDFWHEDEIKNGRWHIIGDTMSLVNGLYFVKIHAYTDIDKTEEGEYNFVNDNGPRVFGKIQIDNISKIINPIFNSFQHNPVPLEARLPGKVNSVEFSIRNESEHLDVATISGNMRSIDFNLGNTYWYADWDSSGFNSGRYTVFLSYYSLDGTRRSSVGFASFSLDMSYFEENLLFEACTPNWVCDDWPTECPSTEKLTRTCTATNCVASGETKEDSLDCEYVDPNTNTPPTNTNSNTTPPPTNTNSNTTPPPTNTNSNTTPPPIIVPIIEMRLPNQGDTISGWDIIKAETSVRVERLEFLYKKRDVRDVNVEELIGQGNRSDDNDLLWQRIWKTDNIPSGQYKVFARATMPDGRRYVSDAIIITVDHENINLNIDNNIEELIPFDEDSGTDSDGDGIPDIIENKVEGLDPNDPNDENSAESINAAFDNGILSNEEVKKYDSGYIIDQPTKSGELKPDKLKVSKVNNISPKIGINNLVFSGIGPPNSYVTIYIYSDPIVVTTKTDENGNFTYTLDKNLLDGEHEVYVTVTDDTGKIQEKSNPLTFFVSRAQAVTEEEYLRGDVNIDTERSEVVNNFVLPALIMVGALILVVGGVFVVNRKKPIQ